MLVWNHEKFCIKPEINLIFLWFTAIVRVTSKFRSTELSVLALNRSTDWDFKKTSKLQWLLLLPKLCPLCCKQQWLYSLEEALTQVGHSGSHDLLVFLIEQGCLSNIVSDFLSHQWCYKDVVYFSADSPVFPKHRILWRFINDSLKCLYTAWRNRFSPLK